MNCSNLMTPGLLFLFLLMKCLFQGTQALPPIVLEQEQPVADFGQWGCRQVIEALTSSCLFRDQSRGPQHVDGPRDSRPIQGELGGNVSRRSRAFKQQFEDSTSDWVGKGGEGCGC